MRPPVSRFGEENCDRGAVPEPGEPKRCQLPPPGALPRFTAPPDVPPLFDGMPPRFIWPEDVPGCPEGLMLRDAGAFDPAGESPKRRQQPEELPWDGTVPLPRPPVIDGAVFPGRNEPLGAAAPRDPAAFGAEPMARCCCASGACCRLTAHQPEAELPVERSGSAQYIDATGSLHFAWLKRELSGGNGQFAMKLADL